MCRKRHRIDVVKGGLTLHPGIVCLRTPSPKQPQSRNTKRLQHDGANRTMRQDNQENRLQTTREKCQSEYYGSVDIPIRTILTEQHERVHNIQRSRATAPSSNLPENKNKKVVATLVTQKNEGFGPRRRAIALFKQDKHTPLRPAAHGGTEDWNIADGDFSVIRRRSRSASPIEQRPVSPLKEDESSRSLSPPHRKSNKTRSKKSKSKRRFDKKTARSPRHRKDKLQVYDEMPEPSWSNSMRSQTPGTILKEIPSDMLTEVQLFATRVSFGLLCVSDQPVPSSKRQQNVYTSPAVNARTKCQKHLEHTSDGIRNEIEQNRTQHQHTTVPGDYEARRPNSPSHRSTPFTTFGVPQSTAELGDGALDMQVLDQARTGPSEMPVAGSAERLGIPKSQEDHLTARSRPLNGMAPVHSNNLHYGHNKKLATHEVGSDLIHSERQAAAARIQAHMAPKKSLNFEKQDDESIFYEEQDFTELEHDLVYRRGGHARDGGIYRNIAIDDDGVGGHEDLATEHQSGTLDATPATILKPSTRQAVLMPDPDDAVAYRKIVKGDKVQSAFKQAFFHPEPNPNIEPGALANWKAQKQDPLYTSLTHCQSIPLLGCYSTKGNDDEDENQPRTMEEIRGLTIPTRDEQDMFTSENGSSWFLIVIDYIMCHLFNLVPQALDEETTYDEGGGFFCTYLTGDNNKAEDKCTFNTTTPIRSITASPVEGSVKPLPGDTADCQESDSRKCDVHESRARKEELQGKPGHRQQKFESNRRDEDSNSKSDDDENSLLNMSSSFLDGMDCDTREQPQHLTQREGHTDDSERESPALGLNPDYDNRQVIPKVDLATRVAKKSSASFVPSNFNPNPSAGPLGGGPYSPPISPILQSTFREEIEPSRRQRVTFHPEVYRNECVNAEGRMVPSKRRERKQKSEFLRQQQQQEQQQQQKRPTSLHRSYNAATHRSGDDRTQVPPLALAPPRLTRKAPKRAAAAPSSALDMPRAE